ncbi:hypothetical protein HPB52_002706 [Rhipicephalus sanguineus]|uniref:Uncharacterized protein n=1 Tax=Rhipicephalus sanguineus TaxID=34632 RepID=A0A9D4PGQ8_RHISA|nr:hypothetical protein HPB52_002706 [Rhipicephalus sanguineus]
MPVPAEQLEKWNAVFDLLLFRQLKDDVDDTLVQKLVTFLDASVRDDSEFGVELWRGCDVMPKLEKAVAVPRTPESLCFALQLIAIFGKLEQMFTSLRDDSRVLKALDRLSDNAGASERVSYLEAVTSFLGHQSGRSWCIEHGVSSKVFQCLQDASVFVQGKAEAFFVAFLESDFSKGNDSEVAAFVDRTLTEELPPRQRRRHEDVIKDISSMALDDADVFARRSAASTLRSWVDRDCLGLRSRHRCALQHCASGMLASDLDCEVQLAGLSIWKTLLGEKLEVPSVVSESAVKEMLGEADTAGFGASMKKAMASDADQEVRKDAQAFLRQLRTRLHDRCPLPGKTREMGCRQDGVDASNYEDNPDCSTDVEAPMECGDSTSNVDRLAAMEEVLDLGVSECLQRKLKLPENIQKPATSLATGTLQLGLVHTEDLLTRLSPLGTFRNCDVEHISLDFHSGDSLLEDILAAAASEHCDRDCY